VKVLIMAKNKSRLSEVRITEGWSLNQLAGAAKISAATLKRAEEGKVVREYIWGKILQGINSLEPKIGYEISDVRS
jgi:transcriptional regulator with XRE-family HTH domain